MLVVSFGNNNSSVFFCPAERKGHVRGAMVTANKLNKNSHMLPTFLCDDVRSFVAVLDIGKRVA